MQYSFAVFASAAFTVVNAVQLTNSVYNNVTAGKDFSIGWTNATGSVTLLLKNGDPNHLQTVSTITSGQSTSPFVWSVPATLPADTYAIEIEDSSSTNFSPQFQLLGATGTASGSTSSVASTSSSPASSSSSAATTSAASTSGTSSAASTASASRNGTVSATQSKTSSAASSASSASKTSAGTSPSGSSTGVPNTNSGSEFASPLALVFLTFAAIFTLN